MSWCGAILVYLAMRAASEFIAHTADMSSATAAIDSAIAQLRRTAIAQSDPSFTAEADLLATLRVNLAKQ